MEPLLSCLFQQPIRVASPPPQDIRKRQQLLRPSFTLTRVSLSLSSNVSFEDSRDTLLQLLFVVVYFAQAT